MAFSMIFANQSTGSLIGAAVVAALLAMLIIASGPGSSNAQEAVTVKGIVVNGTEGEPTPAGIPVLLLVTSPEGALIATSQATTTQDGRFQFGQVPREEEGSYAISVDHAQVFYNASFALEDLAGEIRLTVYEPTQDASVVKVTSQVMVIAGINTKNREISAVEFVRLSNTSDRTLVPNLANPQQLSFLRFALPPMAEELDVGSDLPGGDIVSIGTGFALTSPVVPGDHFVDFSFWFPYRGDSVSYRQSLPQGADVYQVMAPQELTRLQVAPLMPISDVDVQGTPYRAWEGSAFGPGQGIELQLTNLPQPGLAERLEKSVSDGTFWRVAIPCALGAILAFLLLFGTLRRDRRRFAAPTPNSSEVNGEDATRREAVVREIASLDERFQGGDLAEAEYRQRREGLVELVLRSGAPEFPEGGNVEQAPPEK